MTTTWIVDQHMIDHNEQDIVGLLRSAGAQVIVGTFQRGVRGADIPEHVDPAAGPVVVYGSIEFANQLKSKGYIPGVYLQDKALECTSYMSQTDARDLFLNDQRVFATWSDLTRRPDFFYDAFGADTLFVRPNTGRKGFTGLAIPRLQFDQEVNALRQLNAPQPDMLLLVAPAQIIEAEYRLVIVNRQVVSGSRYMLNGAVSLSTDVPAAVSACAHTLAQSAWQPDIAYVCDVAQTPHGPRVVELNALSCSGLYLCDIPALAHAINAAAQLEFDGELSIGDIPPTPARSGLRP